MASIYIHVPFCRSRCRYCAFYSGEPLDQLDGFVSALVVEARLRASRGEGRGPIDTVFFGGGSPALLGPARLASVLRCLDRLWGLAAGVEVSVECNPGGSRDLAGLKVAGITRCSIGVQSLEDTILTRLGRTHTAEEARETVSRAVACGFVSVGVDLLYGLAGTDPDRLGRWVVDLASLGVNHLSAYSLEIHPDTPLAEDPEVVAGADLEVVQWRSLLDAAMGVGLAPYEVSNFARSGAECRHNRHYWDGSAYLGLGPGAHGYQPDNGPWGTRTWNTPAFDDYCAALGEGRMPPGGVDLLDRSAAVLEALFLWLRRPVPLEQALAPPRFAPVVVAVVPYLAPLVAQGDLEVPGFVPTPKGMRRADGLALWLLRRLTDLTERDG